MPTPEDSLDTTAEGEEPETDHTPSSNVEDSAQKDGAAKSKDTEFMDTTNSGEMVETSMDISTDSFENPFLKTPKQSRPLNRP